MVSCRGLADTLDEHGYEVLRPTGSDAHLPGHDYDKLDQWRDDSTIRVKILLVDAAVHDLHQLLPKLYRCVYSHYEGKEAAPRNSGKS